MLSILIQIKIRDVFLMYCKWLVTMRSAMIKYDSNIVEIRLSVVFEGEERTGCLYLKKECI